MRTLFRSLDLWDLVEKGVDEDEGEAMLKEIRKRDAKALFHIQQAVHPSMFSRIAAANTSKEAWEILRREFHGNPKIMAMKLQTLRQTFECLHIKGNESVQ